MKLLNCIIIIYICLCCFGCTTTFYDIQKTDSNNDLLINECTTNEYTTTFYDIQKIDSNNDLLINEIYYNENAHGFRVFQVLDDGILVHHPSKWNNSISNFEYFLNAYITPILNDYVDEQNLKTGWYKYIGIYEYTTVENKKRKVRHFIEVKKEGK